MTWIEDLLSWLSSLGGGHSLPASAGIAFAAGLPAIGLFLLWSRWILPAAFRYAGEPRRASTARRYHAVLLSMLLLTPPGVFFLDRRFDSHWYGKLVLELLVLLHVYIFTEFLLLVMTGTLQRLNLTFPVLLRDIVRILVYFTVFITALRSLLGIADVSAVLGASAFFSIIVGLAVQESLGNLFAGLFLQIDKPLKVGDWIVVNGVVGRVEDINWRATRLVTRDDDHISIPNNSISKADIVNYSAPTPLHRTRHLLHVSYEAQPNRVKRVLTDVALSVKGILAEPAPEVHVVGYGESAIDYELRYWVQDYGIHERVSDQVLTAVWYHFRRHGIVIPFPIRDVVVRREKKAGHTPDPEVLELLRKVDFLAGAKEEDLRLLTEDLTHHIYARGERVFVQGDEGETFYIIWSGSVGVKVRNEGGTEVEVAELRHGSFFGEMSLLTGERRTATVAAKEDADLLELDRASFSVLLRDNPAIAQSISEIIATRLAATRAKVEEAEGSARFRRETSEEVKTISRKILSGIRAIFGFTHHG
ncbi:MAG: mechanosensitive ion channel [Planctomycetes bacterium]|nr:mechanosensitive ion channel [Planctomycetota bacterium]